MSSRRTVTVEAYGILDLPDNVRERVLDRERDDAWGSWVVDEVGAMLADDVRERLDGVADVKVTAWAMLHGGPPSMVVDGRIVDPDAFAASLGVPGHDPGDGLSLAPYHAGGGQWVGATDVVRDGEVDDVLTAALDRLTTEALDVVAAWAESAMSDESLTYGLDEGGWTFDRFGRILDAVIVDEVSS